MTRGVVEKEWGRREEARPHVRNEGEELESVEGAGRSPGLSAQLAVVKLQSMKHYQVYTPYALDR